MENNELCEDSFEDPLENYDAKLFIDPIEKAISEQSVDEVLHRPFVCVSPDITAREAVSRLASEHVSCLLVEEDQKLVGVFTDREVLHHLALADPDSDIKLREVMTSDPVYVYEDDPIAAALCVMAASGYRHVPIVSGDEKIVGIISPQRVTHYLTKNFPT